MLSPQTIALFLSALSLMALCALLINSELWQWAQSRWAQGAVVGLVLVMCLLLSLLCWAMGDRTAGEPLSLTDGISVWPTTCLRLLAFLLCLLFLGHSCRRLRDNEKQLSRRFRFLRPRTPLSIQTGSLVGIHHWRPQPTGDADGGSAVEGI